MISVSKYEGAGNSFLLVDGRTTSLATPQIVSLCQEQQVDGLIFLQTSSRANFRMEIINRDGSNADMCGNGLRCLAKFAEGLGFPSTQKIETAAGILTASIQGNLVSTSMPKIQVHNWSLEVEGLQGAYLDTGVPHFVTFTENLETAPPDFSLSLRSHSAFAPHGANINWAQITGPTSLSLRTFERGVGETLACGTGATAAALALAHRCHLTSGSIAITTRSQEILHIDLDGPTMTGPVRHLFSSPTTL